MALFSASNVKLVGLSAAIPANEVSNYDLKGLSDEEKFLLVKTTGIEKRRIAGADVCASDLCVAAAKKLMDELGWKPSEVEALIYITQTPDVKLPGTSALIQQRLGLPETCYALDVNQGCAGYIYGLSTIASIMGTTKIEKGLLLVGDTITKLLADGDNSTVPIFSDAGSATALVYDENAPAMHFNLQMNGSRHDAIIDPSGGARTGLDCPNHMTMKGHDIFTFGLKEVVPNMNALLAYCSMDKEAIDYFVFHQANRLLNESIRKKMELDPSKVPTTIDKYGNTSCATIPLTMVSEIGQALRTKDLKLALSGFGVGLTWGAALINICDIRCSELIEV